MTCGKIFLRILGVLFMIGLTLFLTLKYVSSGEAVVIWIVVVVMMQIIIAWLVVAQKRK